MSNEQTADKQKGNIFVITAPSGAGKTSLCSGIVERIKEISVSISHTTRPPRGSEKNGVEYKFIGKEAFLDMQKNGLFAECAEIYGNYYGTSLESLDGIINTGQDAILEIEGKGASQIRDRFAEATLIFVLPPSIEELRGRLRRRGTDSEEEIERRVANVRREMEYIDLFDYVVINDVFEEALADLEAIIRAVRLKRAKLLPKVRHLF